MGLGTDLVGTGLAVGDGTGLGSAVGLGEAVEVGSAFGVAVGSGLSEQAPKARPTASNTQERKAVRKVYCRHAAVLLPAPTPRPTRPVSLWTDPMPSRGRNTAAITVGGRNSTA